MRRLKLCLIFCVLITNVYGQDLLYINQSQVVDSVFRNMITKSSTGFLHNRLFMDSGGTISLNTSLFSHDTSTIYSSADNLYGLMSELKTMSFSDRSIPSLKTLYDTISQYVAQNEYDHDLFVIPIGIVDYNFNVLDIHTGIDDGILTREGATLIDLQPENDFISLVNNAKLIAPLFDYHSSDVMAIVFREKDFYSNYRESSDILKIEKLEKENWVKLQWDKFYGFNPLEDSIQLFKIKITFTDNSEVINTFKLNTPELKQKNKSGGYDINDLGSFYPDLFETLIEVFDCGSPTDLTLWYPGCFDCDDISDGQGNSIKWCFIPSCSRENLTNPRPVKPYILVAGWRPPVIGQSFKKTWEIYDSKHGHMLSQLRQNDYDIILVKFNIHVKPNEHGMIESADLLAQFLTKLNDELKVDKSHENVIQGSSMGADIIRLALLKMEKKHLADNSYSHHHTRLNISHDGNFYGANIPLAYQLQIYSEYWAPHLLGTNNLIVPFLLKTFLYATLEQKSMKELLMYHPTSDINESSFLLSNFDISISPSLHWRRQGYYNALNAVDNGFHIFPMPISTRNISISLGKISGRNSDGANSGFKNAGDYWHNFDIGIYKLRLGSAKYLPAGQTFQLFKRQFTQISVLPPSYQTKHIVNVSQMQEVDDCAASYLKGTGNMISIVDWTYFPVSQIFNGKNYFSHKSVLTALGINKNLWPANGTHILNMQNMGLMFSGYQPNGQLLLSDHFGYPHLGNPSNHFQITPFEAIYVDNKIDPHIVLEDSDQGDVAVLNGFIFNEVEPWYLGLQNKVIGATARPNYTYRVYRRAKNSIVVGYHVTPTTDDGDYIVQPNAVVNLRAGESIHLFPGTHFLPGSSTHLKIEYSPCTN